MLETWLLPILSWLGIGLTPFLILVAIILLIILILRG